MAGPRSYTNLTRQRLFGLSRNKCAFPSCEEEMSHETTGKHSNICHIEAAKVGGERWNADMSDKQRADYKNLILLCPPHHHETDDVEKYTVCVIKEIKKNHEREMEIRCSVDQPLSKRPSLLAHVINKMSVIDIEDVKEDEEVITNSFSVEDKLTHNNVVENRGIILDYCVYQGKINTLYNELERAGSTRKITLLRNVKSTYLKAKGKVLGNDQSLVNVRLHADQIIEYVKRRLHEQIDASGNNDSDLSYEEVEFAVSIVMVDAFMRCKILEEPSK